MKQGKSLEEIVLLLQSGKVGIMPTDTVYGIVANALDSQAVERMYTIKNRDTDKPPIMLIDSFERLKDFGIPIEQSQAQVLGEIWPGAVSVIFPVPGDTWKYLHRGKESLAFRVPKNKTLRGFLQKTGPLATSSANKQGEKIIQTLKEGQKIWGETLDFYGGDECIHGGNTLPSTLIALRKDAILVYREGAVSTVFLEKIGKKIIVK